MSHANIPLRSKGFTLVELLVIAPIALLVITGFVALMVTMVGDVIATRTNNLMTYDTQSALATIERDVRLSTEFLTTSGTLPSPQGKNGATSEFSAAGGDLVLGSIATDKNPIDPMRSFVYYNGPSPCGDSTTYQNRIFFITVVYTVRDGSLWRRTYVPVPDGTLCAPGPWQVNSCAPGYTATDTRCRATDELVLKNVKNFTVEYYINPEDTIAAPSTSASNASSIRVSLQAEQKAAGRTVTVASAGRSSKLTSQDVNLDPPIPPVVTGSNSGRDAVFSWPSVSTASAYIIKYSINGGGWTTATESTTDTSFSLPANHGDLVSVEVMARNTTGTSSKGTASVTIPLWIDCPLQNGWVNYSATYAPCQFTKTKDGVVVLQGLIKDGTRGGTQTLFKLPEGYQPSSTQMFNGMITGDASVRVQVSAGGTVSLVDATGGGASTYLSLSGVLFIPADSAYTWTNLTLLNGWQNYGTGWPVLSTTRDGSGRVHIRGLIQQGTYTLGTTIATLPAGSAPETYQHILVRSAPGTPGQPNLFGVDASGNILARGVDSSSYQSMQAMFYPGSYTGWLDFTTVSGTPASGQMGNSWVTYSTSYLTSYTKSSDGIVTVRGLIKGGANGTTIAVLPTGYRPSNRLIIPTVVSGNTAARIDVFSTNGTITAQSGTSSTWTAFNFSFRAAP